MNTVLFQIQSAFIRQRSLLGLMRIIRTEFMNRE